MVGRKRDFIRKRDFNMSEEKPKTTQIVVPEGGLEFVTPDGRLLARLRDEPGEGATLILADADDGPAVSLGAMATGGGLIAWSRYCRGYASLSANDVGGCVNIGDPDKRLVASLMVQEGAGIVSVGTPDGEAKAYLWAGPAGGLVAVNNNNGLQVAALGVHDSDGVIQALSQAEVRVFVVPAWKLTDAEKCTAEKCTDQEKQRN